MMQRYGIARMSRHIWREMSAYFIIRKLFSQLKVMPGRIISMNNKNTPLTRNLSVQTIDDYLKWIGKIHN